MLTALPVEFLAVQQHLEDCRDVTLRQGNVYVSGLFRSAGDVWEIGIAEIGRGNSRAAQETERAIATFDPSVVLFVGVAGGLKDVALGDVVAGTKIYAYESGKDAADFLPRPDVGNCSYAAEQRARAEARRPDWLARVLGPQPPTEPRVFVGPIAAGEKVVASTKSSAWSLLRALYSDALAVEEEGRGFLQAAFANPGIDALVIRGISDLLDDKERAEVHGSQQVASAHASAFAFQVLSQLRRDASQKPDQIIAVPGDLIKLPDTDDLPVPLWCREYLDLHTNPQPYVSVLQMPNRLVPDLIVSALDPGRPRYVIRLRSVQRGQLDDRVEALTSLAGVRPQSANVECHSVANDLLEVTVSFEAPDSESELPPETELARRYVSAGLDDVQVQLFPEYPVMSRDRGQVDGGWIRRVAWRAQVRAYANPGNSQIDLNKAVVSADGMRRVIRFVFPRGGSRTIRIAHTVTPNSFAQLMKRLRDLAHVLSFSLERGRDGPDTAVLVAVCEPWSDVATPLTLHHVTAAFADLIPDLRVRVTLDEGSDRARLANPSRQIIEPGVSGHEDPTKAGVTEDSVLSAAKNVYPVTRALKWSRLSPEDFERLILNLIQAAEGYSNPQLLMQTNAQDRGRDLSVERVLTDPLSGTTHQRVIIQAKHWLSRSVGVSNLAEVSAQMDLWGHPPVDVLIFATSGRFTVDAVEWIEDHNTRGARPKIEMWPDTHLELLLASRPQIVDHFHLR